MITVQQLISLFAALFLVMAMNLKTDTVVSGRFFEKPSAENCEYKFQEKSGESLVKEKLSGSGILRSVHLKQFGAVEWTLSNNAKVIYKKVEYENDNVILSAYSLGGYSLYNPDMLPSAIMLPAIIETYGIGEYDSPALQKLMSGKRATAAITLGELSEGISGSSTPEDFETMMQMLYLRFEKPRFDKEAHTAVMSRYDTYFKNMAKDPTKIMQDSVSLYLTNFSPRTMIMNQGFLKHVDFEMIGRIYSERFRNAADFKFFIVGNISEDRVIPLIEKYIGSITGFPEKENWIDRKISRPKGNFTRDIQIFMPVPKATVFISHSQSLEYNSFNNVVLKVIQVILDKVITEKGRKIANGAFGVSINISSQKFPVQQASDLIMFDCDTAQRNIIKMMIYKEINDISIYGPGKEYLDWAVNNLLKNREESKLHNIYWSNVLYAYYYTGVNADDPENYENILRKLTINDIMRVAKNFFSNADMEEIVFRPKIK
jgi:zinc protease